MIELPHSKRLPLAILVSCALLIAPADAQARIFGKKNKKLKPQTQTRRVEKPKNNGSTASVSATTDGRDTAGDTAAPNGPVIVTPSSLVDLTTARFAKLDIALKDAAFLEASVGDLRLIADNMDMNKGTLETLSVQVDGGNFQEFTVDSLSMFSHGAPLKFNTVMLLNNKVLQFEEPASAKVRVGVSQRSLNAFLNSQMVLARLSGAAKKRVPILSTLAHQDVNFGFNFTKADLKLAEDNRIKLSIDSKLGMGKVGMPVTVSAETKLMLADGWVTLSDTKLHTGAQTVPQDMATKIVHRINDLSKWGTQSDDIKFQFTDLKVLPDDRLELEGTALIKRLRFARNQEPQPITPPAPAKPLDAEPEQSVQKKSDDKCVEKTADEKSVEKPPESVQNASDNTTGK